jgi:hypothetical protein
VAGPPSAIAPALTAGVADCVLAWILMCYPSFEDSTAKAGPAAPNTFVLRTN